MSVTPRRARAPTEHANSAGAGMSAPPRMGSARSPAREGLTISERAWLHGQVMEPAAARTVTPPSPPSRRKKTPAPQPASPAAAPALERDAKDSKYRMVLACTCRSMESPRGGA